MNILKKESLEAYYSYVFLKIVIGLKIVDILINITNFIIAKNKKNAQKLKNIEEILK